MKYLFLTPLFCIFLQKLNAVPTYSVRDTCIIPTAFTPNDDGQNDEFIIPCLEREVKNESELWVFTEWGERILHEKPYTNTWTGDSKGKPLPDGTYYYIFRLKARSEIQRGFVTIFR
jgi:gliding motility-associated-like protein